jgi:carbamoyltransferase
MLIIGLNAYHGDAAACILSDGVIIAAVEEERFRRIKHWAGFPSESLRYCLAEAGASLADVDHVAVNSNPRASLMRRLSYVVRRRPDPRLVLDRIRNQQKRSSVEAELARTFPGQSFNGQLHRVEHHLAHMASAFLVSPFKRAVTVSIDGFGDFSSAAWGLGQDRELSLDGRVWFPHSLGVFYQAITQLLGFPHYGDEYKVMGLAPYGEPKYLNQMRDIIRLMDDGSFRLNLEYFRHHREKIEYEWSGGTPHVGTLYSDGLLDLLGPARSKDGSIEQRHRDLARSAQAMYEEAFFHLLRRLHARYGEDSLTLAGGCAMNSVANGKVMRNSPFKRVYVQSAAGDAGGALGAAIYVWHQIGGVTHRANGSALSGDAVEGRTIMDHAYLGTGTDNRAIDTLLSARAAEIANLGCRIEICPNEAELARNIAGTVSEGKVVGWFQGRMEFGPRALGNRSIVCDPRRADMKDILNQKIKRRENFRPFAPSILREHVSQWFEEEADVPFMMQVFQIRADRRAVIPAVTHVDGSGRLQTVHLATNPRYYRLIEAFFDITGVPIVLNTSFNENEPVVCRPEEALDCFLRTKMDVLVLGDAVVRRAST